MQSFIESHVLLSSLVGYVVINLALFIMSRKWDWLYDNPFTGILMDAFDIDMGDKQDGGLTVAIVFFILPIALMSLLGMLLWFAMALLLCLFIVVPRKIVNYGRGTQ